MIQFLFGLAFAFTIVGLIKSPKFRRYPATELSFAEQALEAQWKETQEFFARYAASNQRYCSDEDALLLRVLLGEEEQEQEASTESLPFLLPETFMTCTTEDAGEVTEQLSEPVRLLTRYAESLFFPEPKFSDPSLWYEPTSNGGWYNTRSINEKQHLAQFATVEERDAEYYCHQFGSSFYSDEIQFTVSPFGSVMITQETAEAWQDAAEEAMQDEFEEDYGGSDEDDREDALADLDNDDPYEEFGGYSEYLKMIL